MTILETHIDEVNKLCSAYRVSRLYAFGSVITDRFNGDSDIDFVVNFEPMNLEEYADNYYDFKFSLEDVFQKPVDLLEDKAIKNPHFRQVVNEQRRLVYEH